MKWFSVDTNLPKIDELVLCYYEIGEYKYYVVGKIYSISTTQYSENEFHKSMEWRDSNNDVIDPQMWARFPKVKKFTEAE